MLIKDDAHQNYWEWGTLVTPRPNPVALKYIKNVVFWMISASKETFNFNFIFWRPFIKFYNSDHGLLNWNGLACCKQQTKTNRPVQTDYLSHATSFLFYSSRVLFIILRIGRFYLYIQRRTINEQHNKI